MTIFVTEPPVSYTDYTICYRKEKGTIKGCLTLITFCNKMRKGDYVKVGDIMFVAPPSGTK